MKHLGKLFLASLFLMSFTAMQAQTEDNPWSLGLGINAVDYYPTGEDAPLGGTFEDFFNTGDHWNILPGLSRISVGRYIGAGFVFEGAASMNQIEQFGDENIGSEVYVAFDGTFNYSFRGDDGWFDPVLGAGAGYSWMGDTEGVTLDGTAALNFWITDNFALSVQTIYKHALSDDYNTHWQHVAGVKFALGGRDSDGDGIYDKNDECPEQAGLEEFNGCPDSDGDGIEDRMDQCPDEAGLPQFDGCPDTDGDGIANPQDECPNVAGLESLNGCPDADGDGVRDSEDDCPDEAGPADNNGCPFEDRDEDGVLDKDDECPDVAGTVENDGCPEPDVEIINELNEYSRTILFDLDKSTIRQESHETLESIAEIMEEYSNTIFHIEGHTDSTGAAEYNENLSRERAESVRQFLIEQGIPESRLTSEGYGEAEPISSNNTAQGRQENRRVEISLDKEREMRDSGTNGNNTNGMEE